MGNGVFGPFILNKQDILLSFTASAQDPEGAEYNKSGYGIVLTVGLDNDTPMPTGSIFFYQGDIVLGEAAIQDVDGALMAVWTGAPLYAGENISFRVEFLGDSNYNSAYGTAVCTVSPSTDVSVKTPPQQNKV